MRILNGTLACLIVSLGVVGCSSSGNGNGGNETDDPTNQQPGTAIELPALPSPALTEAPSSNDEPEPEPGEYHTVTDYTILRDTGPRIPVEELPSVTEEEYNDGPLDPVLEVPTGIDSTADLPPYFEGLTDHEVLAGEQLNILFNPVNPEGGIPGMYPQELPKGAEFVDNFDGTKTLTWIPLQKDVGIREFTAVALDPDNSGYRSHHTIRIKIDMPDDPSSIPNVAPYLEEYPHHTVKVNTPVVMALKGIDLNGPDPLLSLPSPPAGSTFIQHSRYPDYWILRFVPTVTGALEIDVDVTDSEDSSLFETGTVTLTVLADGDFARSGSRLKDLAEQHDLKIGYASLYEFYRRPDGIIYAETAAQEFNLVTAENALKMNIVNPEPGRYQWSDMDNTMTFATRNAMEVRGHPLVWHQLLPDWILETPAASRQGHMQEYIHRLMSRYSGRVQYWDVVNEAIADDGTMRNSIWYEAMGEDYIELAFRQARATDSSAKLLLTDYDIAVNGPKSDAFFALLERLLDVDTPIDGVGFQLHIWSDFDQFEDVRQNFQRVADLGLDIHVTELDVAMNPAADEGGDLAQQAAVYRQILQLCLEQPRCNHFQTWGFTDQYSWRENHTPLMFDKNYQMKPAYRALQEVLAQ